MILLRRVISSFIVLLGVISIVFFVIHIAPGDPSHRLISPHFSELQVESLHREYNLNAPLIEQYYSFILKAVQFDFGVSFSYKMNVVDVISEYFSFTVIFSLLTFLFQIISSSFLLLMVVKINSTFFEKLLDKILLSSYLVPPFVTGLFLVLVFSVSLKLFPISGISAISGTEFNLLEFLHHLCLPIITLSLTGTAIYYKYMKESITKIQDSDFILYLRSLGCSETTILFKHIVPNILGTVINIAGIELGILLGGALITEVLFGLPGMGRLTIDAIMARDYPLIMGCTIISCLAVVSCNLLADLIRGIIDKRVLSKIIE